jgi:hypothetical protein
MVVAQVQRHGLAELWFDFFGRIGCGAAAGQVGKIRPVRPILGSFNYIDI